MTVEYCREQQLACAAEIETDTRRGGASLGLFDWFTEELLMTYETLGRPGEIAIEPKGKL